MTAVENSSSPSSANQVAFRKSSSRTEAFALEKKKPGVAPLDIFTHPKEWLKFRFTGEHLFGTTMQLLSSYSTFELMRSGIKSNDATRIYGGAMATAVTLWALISERGARQYEGKNFFENAGKTILHSSQSNTQFSWLVSLPINTLLTSGNFIHGYQNIKEGGIVAKEGWSRMAQGSSSVVSSALMFTSLFKKKEQAHNDTQNDNLKPQRATHANTHLPEKWTEKIKNVAIYSLREDKGGLLGRSMMLSNNLFRLYEAIQVIQRQRGSGKDHGGTKLLRNSVTGTAVILMLTYYEHLTMYNDSKRGNLR